MNMPAGSEAALAFLLACCVKTTIFLACAWVISVALRLRSSSAQRHHIWAAAILTSLALPFFALLLPAWRSVTLGSAATFWSSANGDTPGYISRTIPSIIINAAAGSPTFNKLAAAALFAWGLGFALLI